jgi:hypothetical protein
MKRWILAATLIATGSIASTAMAQPAGGAPGGGGAMGAGQGGAALRAACRTDIEQLCANVQPGGGRIGQCLREHQDRVSEACKSAISDAHAMHHQQSAPAPANPPN